jgi:endonuclease G
MYFHEYNAAEISPGRLRIDYDPIGGLPRSVSYIVTPEAAGTAQESGRSFGGDVSTEGAQSSNPAYAGSGYERGHLAQREAFAGDPEAERAADLFTNIAPQLPGLNRLAGSTWRDSERWVMAEALRRDEPLSVEIVPQYAEDPPTLSDGTPIPFEFVRRVMAPDGTVIRETRHK